MRQKGKRERSIFSCNGLMDYRCDQARVYLETLIEIFPHSMELWMELLTTTDQPTAISEVKNLTHWIIIDYPQFQILDRARKSTGIHYELVYSLVGIPSKMNH